MVPGSTCVTVPDSSMCSSRGTAKGRFAVYPASPAGKINPFAGEKRVDFRGWFDRFTGSFMKNDTTTTVLNFVLAALVILGVVFALLAMSRTRELRQLSLNATLANNGLLRAQALANDATAYNATAKSPELTRILQAIQPKPAATK